MPIPKSRRAEGSGVETEGETTSPAVVFRKGSVMSAMTQKGGPARQAYSPLLNAPLIKGTVPPDVRSVWKTRSNAGTTVDGGITAGNVLCTNTISNAPGILASGTGGKLGFEAAYVMPPIMVPNDVTIFAERTVSVVASKTNDPVAVPLPGKAVQPEPVMSQPTLTLPNVTPLKVQVATESAELIDGTQRSTNTTITVAKVRFMGPLKTANSH
jgi:hypothetical protein